MFSLLRSFSLLLFAILCLSACDDNPTVGGGLIDDQATPSQRYALTASNATRNIDFKDVAGQRRTVLVGKVAETGDLAGLTTEATGYIDFGGTPTIPDRFKNNPITEVSLQLVYKKGSVYGDTTQTMSIDVKEMTASFNAISGARYDSLLTNQSATTLVSATHRPQKRDTSITISLPTEWISSNATRLKDATKFSEEHFGFALSASAGNGMIGINEERSRLRLVGGDATGRDTVYFSVAAYHSYTKQTGSTTALSTDKTLIQDNTGATLNPIFDFTLPSLQNVAVGNATLRIYADSTLMKSTGSFNRTPLRNLSLYGIFTDTSITTPQLITSATLLNGIYSFTSPAFSERIQKNLSNKPVFSRYFIAPSTSPQNTIADVSANSVYGAVLYNQNAAPDKKPQLIITYSSTN